MVGAVGAARGEHAHFLFAAEPWRAHHLRPAFIQYAVKDKTYPHIIEIFQPAHAVCGKFGIQLDAGFCGGDQTGLAGDAEFLFVGRAGGADGGKGISHKIVDKFFGKTLSYHSRFCRFRAVICYNTGHFNRVEMMR